MLGNIARKFTNYVKDKAAPVVRVVNLEGVIASGRGGSFNPRFINIANMNPILERAFEPSATLKAVALSISSLGGSPAQSSEIMKRIRMLSEQRNIPVLSFVHDVAASGGYYIALAGDEIYVNENSIVGSIGVITSTFGFQETLKKLGIERRLYYMGSKKSLLDPFLPLKEEDVQRLKERHEQIHKNFIKVVQLRRKNKLHGPEEELFSGDFWTGEKAVEYGLADAVGDIWTVSQAKFGANTKVVPVVSRTNVFDYVLGRASQTVADEIVGGVEMSGMKARYGI